MAGSQGAGHEDERAKYCCKEIREPVGGHSGKQQAEGRGASPEQVYNGTDSDLQPSDWGDKFLLFLSHPVYGTLL